MIYDRKTLIEAVKATGQEIIDRAEDFVGDNDMVTSMELRVNIEPGCLPELTLERKYSVKRYLDMKAGADA